MSRYAVIIAPIAKKQIGALPSNIKERIANVLELLSRNPLIGKALKAELAGLYSYRIGDYRVIYDIIRHSLMIRIIKVMHRREVYR